MSDKSNTNRFQVDLNADQMQALEFLTGMAGLRTKREFFENALTLFRWAARERMQGRTICSIDAENHQIKELEMPALSAIASRGLVVPLVSEDELRLREAQPGRPLKEILSNLKE